jgi:hypothetical protein
MKPGGGPGRGAAGRGRARLGKAGGGEAWRGRAWQGSGTAWLGKAGKGGLGYGRPAPLRCGLRSGGWRDICGRRGARWRRQSLWRRLFGR